MNTLIDPKSFYRSSHPLREELDVCYLAFTMLRRSDADTDGLAAEAAWACWRARRLLLNDLGDFGPIRRPRVWLQAGWLAAGTHWGARPRHDVATAALVQSSLRRLVAGLALHRSALKGSGQIESCSRRINELDDVCRRAERVHERLKTARLPIWQSFLPRPGA